MRRLFFCRNYSSVWGVLAIILLCPIVALAQPSWSWAQEGDAGNDQRGFSICTDGSGNNYSTGYFDGSVDFDGNILSAVNGDDVYLTKYTSAGIGLWAVAISGNGDERGYGVTCDATGNVYVCGVFEGTITFYGSPNINLTSTGNDDIFIASFNSSGSVLWAKKAGGVNDDEATAICTDGTGVYITGSFNGTSSFGALPSLVSAGGADVFVTAYLCTTGVEQWAVRGGTTVSDKGDGIAVDGSGIYVTGYYGNATCSFQNHVGSLNPNGSTDVFLVKYDLTGTAGLWQRRAGGSSGDEGTCVRVIGNTVYVGGFFAGTMSLYNGGPVVTTLTAAAGTDGFIVQYDATTGNFIWIRSENGTGDDRIFDISTTTAGAVYTTGVWQGTLPFGNGPSVSTSTRDIFVTAYNSAGVFAYGARATGDDDDYGMGIATFNTDVYITGYYSSSDLTFGATPAMNSSAEAVFLAKLICGVSPPNAGTDQTICSANAILAGNNPSSGTGTWTLISGAGTITTPASPSSGITGLGIGANVFRWTISNGICSSMDEVTITRDANPTTSNAGPNQSICVSSAGLAANLPATGTGIWTLVSGTGTITAPTSPTSGVTGISVGTSIFQWTISNGVCPTSTDQISVTRDPDPTAAIAGSDQTICSSNATLTGNSPTVGTGFWTLISGSGTITSPGSPGSGVTGLAVGNNVFEWTTSNGTCPSSSDQVTITVDPNPSVANAGVDQTICSSTSILNGNSPTIGTGVWTLISGGGTITSPTSSSSGVSGLNVGANIFQWTISNGTCPASTDQVILQVDAMPSTAVAGSDQITCDTTAMLAAGVPSIGVGTWSLFAGTATVVSPASASSAVYGLGTGQNHFVWTVANGVCPVSNDTMIIQVDEKPSAAVAGNDQTLCNTAALLSGNIPVTGNGYWTLITGSGSIGNPASSITNVTGLSIGPNIFQWTISNGVCADSADQVIIQVDALPTVADAGSDQVFCSGTTTLSGNTPVIGTGIWSLISGSGNFVNSSSPVTGVTGLLPGLSTYEWKITNGVCPSSTDIVQLTVDTVPSVANAGNDNTHCVSSDTLVGNLPLTGVGIWTLISGAGVVQNPASPVSAVNGLGIGVNIFAWTISNGTCPSSTDQVSISRDAVPDNAAAGSDLNSCSPNGVLSGNTPITGTGTWSVMSGAAIVANPSAPQTPVSGFSVGTNEFIWTISNGTCPASSDTIAITYNQSPTPSVAGADIFACDEQITMQAQVPLVGSGTWDPINGSPLITDASNPYAVVPPLPAGTWNYIWTTQNGFCVSPSDTISITVYSPPDSAICGNDLLIYYPEVELSAIPISTGTGTWTFVQGSGIIEDIHDPFTRVSDLSTGVNILRWTTSNGVCPVSSDDMRIEVMPLIIPEGFSPNGDGVNDQLEITGLTEFENASLEVFNRWGNVVYMSAPYRNDWTGNGESGESLPDDVYFYVLKADTETVFTGYIIIKRNVQ